MYRHSLLFILLMSAATQAQAFFCFSFGSSSSGRGGPAYNRRLPPPPPPAGYINPYLYRGAAIPGYSSPLPAFTHNPAGAITNRTGN